MVPSCNIIKPLHGQRGSVAILFVLFLPVLLGFTALTIDLARLNLTKIELQNAADAAALAGVRSLSDPSILATDKPYNWSAATATALDVAKRNFVNGALIRHALIETGYWNLQNPSLGLRQLSTPGAGDVAAIRATIALSSGQNNGPLRLFFAPILGIADRNIQASAIAVLPAPGGGTGLFPLVISKTFIDQYWNPTTRTAILKNGAPQIVNICTIYKINGIDVLSGQWTTFTSQENDVPYVRGLIANGNPTNLSIGMSTYIQPGAEATLYKPSELPVGKDVAVFLVNNVVTSTFQPIVAIAGFHITDSNQGQKYIEGYFIDNVSFGTTDPGTGNGLPYGAYTPPILVQ